MSHLTQKLEKIRRYLSWRLASGNRLPLWWHIGRPNFGDDLNPSIFGELTETHFRFASNRNVPHLLGMGSILEFSNPFSIVCGSGFLNQPSKPTAAEHIIAVRGHLSRAALKKRENTLLGDPMVLISEIFKPSEPKQFRYGFVPHYWSTARWRNLIGQDAKLIDPGASPLDVVRDISRCEFIISQSLHGLIVADALGIPNVWIAPSDQMAGGRFKFDDYFTTLDAPKEIVPESQEVFIEPWRFDTTVGYYRYCKTSYRKALAEAAAGLKQQMYRF